jgi:hypothetical protein
MKIEILSPLMTERLGNRLWLVLAPFGFSVDGIPFEIPAGFVYDGNSSPRVMWALCSPVGGVYGEAGPPHDYFYSLDCPIVVPRKYADNVHRAIGIFRGSNEIRAKLVYDGIRLGGESSFRKIHSVEKLNEKTCYDFQYAHQRVLTIKEKGGLA